MFFFINIGYEFKWKELPFRSSNSNFLINGRGKDIVLRLQFQGRRLPINSPGRTPVYWKESSSSTPYRLEMKDCSWPKHTRDARGMNQEKTLEPNEVY